MPRHRTSSTSSSSSLSSVATDPPGTNVDSTNPFLKPRIPPQISAFRLPSTETKRFIFWVGASSIRTIQKASQPQEPSTLNPNRIYNKFKAQRGVSQYMSHLPLSDCVFWYTSYHEAATACSVLRANGMSGVQMAVVWAEGMSLYDVNGMGQRTDALATTSGECGKSVGERLYSQPLTEADLGMVAVEFKWVDVVYVPGLTGHVRVPKHVLDHREEDGDSDLWGKLQRGLMDEMYLANGKIDPKKTDMLLKAMTAAYEFSSGFDMCG